MTRYITEILAGLFLCLVAFFVVREHFTNTCDHWFHFEDLMSNEVAASLCAVAAVALVIGKYLGKYLR